VEHALEVVTEHCRTADEQARAVAALSFKCDVLWSMLDAIAWLTMAAQWYRR
jgi:pyrroloquinoline-quinone synthase